MVFRISTHTHEIETNQMIVLHGETFANGVVTRKDGRHEADNKMTQFFITQLRQRELISAGQLNQI